MNIPFFTLRGEVFMFVIKDLKHADIQRELQESLWAVNRIKQSLGIDKPVTFRELYRLIIEDLRSMNYEIKYEPALNNLLGNQSAPAFVEYKTPDRTEGGTIKLNPDYPAKDRIEALAHEYIHIKDHSLPLSTTFAVSSGNKTPLYGSHYDGDIMNQERFENMLNDLNEMNFRIMYDSALNIPAMTILNTAKSIDGGTIKLSRRFSTYEQLTALYGEYENIKGYPYPVPIYEIYDTPIEGRVEFDKSCQKQVEFKAEMRAYTLLMPPEELKQRLIEAAYDIDKVLSIKYEYYYYMGKSSVLQWISIVSGIPCHFAWIMCEKNNDNSIIQVHAHDNCYYDSISDPKPFPIYRVLGTIDSAATSSIMTREPVHKESNIDGKSYYCYAYYESGLTKEIKHSIIPDFVSISYDRLLVIGWEKAVYDTIQRLLRFD
jgi:hypothetical protein